MIFTILIRRKKGYLPYMYLKRFFFRFYYIQIRVISNEFSYIYMNVYLLSVSKETIAYNMNDYDEIRRIDKLYSKI